MQERLQKILSAAGISSRRAAESLITEGRVTVNGTVITTLGSKADPATDKICLDGKAITVPQTKRYILLNKPAGYVTTLKDPDGRPIISDLLKGIPERLYPVGRLDFNTEGLILLTNDGEWANRLAHPRNEIEKEYLVKIRGGLSVEQAGQLEKGVELDDGITAPAKVTIIRVLEKNVWFTITIHEGRYRQVRRMCEALGLPVVKLKRVRYGCVLLGDLGSGEYRPLDPGEAKALANGMTPVKQTPQITPQKPALTKSDDQKQKKGLQRTSLRARK